MLTSAKSFRKIEAIQKRALSSIINNYESTYEDSLNKTGKLNMKLRRIRGLCVEIYKTLNNLNSNFLKDLFRLHVTNTVQTSSSLIK